MIYKLFLLPVVVAVACGAPQTPAPCAESSQPPAPADDAPVVDDEGERQPPPGCKLATGRLRLTFAAHSTAGDFATWFAAASCRTVILANGFAVRPFPRALEREIEVAGLDQLFRALLAEMGLGVAIDGNLAVVFDDATKLVATVDADNPRVVSSAGLPHRGASDEFYGDAIATTDETHYVIERDLFDKILADPARLGRGARIVPSIKDGKYNGFKLYAIRPSSLYARIGFRNGDTVHAVNGDELTTPDRALETYDKVKSADRFEFDITRRGKPLVLVLEID